VWLFHEIENHITRSKMSNREMVTEMTKEEVIKIMLDSINEDNKMMCLQNGMSEEDANAQIEQSQPSLVFLFGNIYDKLTAAGALV
jgi:phosphoheptose isomerase